MANPIILELVRSIDWSVVLKKSRPRCYKDDIVDVCIEVVKELEYAHDIDWVEITYTDKTMHVALSIGEKPYYGIFPFVRLDRYYKTCLELTEEKMKDIRKRFTRLLLDAISRR